MKKDYPSAPILFNSNLKKRVSRLKTFIDKNID